jgi:hypothetical protein
MSPWLKGKSISSFLGYNFKDDPVEEAASNERAFSRSLVRVLCSCCI